MEGGIGRGRVGLRRRKKRGAEGLRRVERSVMVTSAYGAAARGQGGAVVPHAQDALGCQAHQPQGEGMKQAGEQVKEAGMTPTLSMLKGAAES